jgi:outer membrane protein assembly factor BamB
MKISSFFFTTVCIFFLSACNACKSPPIVENPQAVKLDLDFKESITTAYVEDIIVEGNIAYLINKYSGMVYAYNLDTHMMIWQCINPIGLPAAPSFLYGNLTISPEHIFVYNERSNGVWIAQIEKMTGTVYARYCIEGMEYTVTSYNRIYHDGILYAADGTRGILKMDLNKRVQIQTSPLTYSLPLEYIPYQESYQQFSTAFIPYGTSVIIAPHGEAETGGGFRGYVSRVDLDTGQTLWTIPNRYGASHGLIYQGLLYFSAYDLVEKRQNYLVIDPETGEIVKKIIDLGKSFTPASASGDKVFFISVAWVGSPEWGDMDSMVCISSKTHEVLWSRPAENPDKGTMAQEYNGILYAPTGDSIELYDAETGEKLGFDTTLWGDGYLQSVTVKYKDVMLISDGVNFYGIKMNWIHGVNGLEKVGG